MPPRKGSISKAGTRRFVRLRAGLVLARRESPTSAWRPSARRVNGRPTARGHPTPSSVLSEFAFRVTSTRRRRSMGYSDFDGHYRRAWNAGRKIGAKRVLRQKDVWPIRFWLDQEGRIRDSRALRPRDRQQAAKMRPGPRSHRRSGHRRCDQRAGARDSAKDLAPRPSKMRWSAPRRPSVRSAPSRPWRRYDRQGWNADIRRSCPFIGETRPYSVVFPSKCSCALRASSHVRWTVPSMCSGGP